MRSELGFMIGYSDHGVGYLDPDRHDLNVQFLIEEERMNEAYLDDRREDTEYFLSIGFEDTKLMEDDLNEIFCDKWW